jgi:hypothetical protein
MLGPAVPAVSQPLSGAAFDQAIIARQVTFQDTLRIELQDIAGCFVTGPLGGIDADSIYGYGRIRVVCADLQTLEQALERLEKSDIVHVQSVSRYLDEPAPFSPPGFRGVEIALLDGRVLYAFTYQQLRFLIWARSWLSDSRDDAVDSLNAYARAVSHYLYMIDMLEDTALPPDAGRFGVSPERDLYAPAPPYVIEGYQNYKDFMQAHAGIYTDFADGLLGFVPTDSLMIMIKQQAPHRAFPNKEASRFQDEMKEFFERDGDPRMLHTLTRAICDTLRAGEYFFAVGLNGTVRFGRELLREEVQAIENATGHKVARANHAFLFPGEPVLTAGAFFIGDSTGTHLRMVNAQSGHYFYSNVSATIREDISVNSNEYLLTLGHFFLALDALGIGYDSVLIMKF